MVSNLYSGLFEPFMHLGLFFQKLILCKALNKNQREKVFQKEKKKDAD